MARVRYIPVAFSEADALRREELQAFLNAHDDALHVVAKSFRDLLSSGVSGGVLNAYGKERAEIADQKIRAFNSVLPGDIEPLNAMVPWALVTGGWDLSTSFRRGLDQRLGALRYDLDVLNVMHRESQNATGPQPNLLIETESGLAPARWFSKGEPAPGDGGVTYDLAAHAAHESPRVSGALALDAAVAEPQPDPPASAKRPEAAGAEIVVQREPAAEMARYEVPVQVAQAPEKAAAGRVAENADEGAGLAELQPAPEDAVTPSPLGLAVLGLAGFMVWRVFK